MPFHTSRGRRRLTELARDARMSVAALRRANPIIAKQQDKIFAGQKVRIPTSPRRTPGGREIRGTGPTRAGAPTISAPVGAPAIRQPDLTPGGREIRGNAGLRGNAPKKPIAPLVSLTGDTKAAGPGRTAQAPDRLTPEQIRPKKAILPNIRGQDVSTSPVVRLTAGGLEDRRLSPSEKPVASSAVKSSPLVLLTGGGVNDQQFSTELRSILTSPDVAIQQGTIYDPGLIQEGYAGPGIEGAGSFVVTDLSDVALLRRDNPDADIFYNDPNDPGPLQAVGGAAAFLPALEQYLLARGRGEDFPQGIVDTLIRLGFLEGDTDLFPLPDEFGFGGGGFGGGGFGGGGFGGGLGRQPNVNSFFSGLFNWRIRP